MRLYLKYGRHIIDIDPIQYIEYNKHRAGKDLESAKIAITYWDDLISTGKISILYDLHNFKDYTVEDKYIYIDTKKIELINNGTSYGSHFIDSIIKII